MQVESEKNDTFDIQISRRAAIIRQKFPKCLLVDEAYQISEPLVHLKTQI